eukprot:CAMPEP_0196657480 /NCGR_PEP_ID=MMETSP1086-20130531/23647_1 /TAXON_ID=77921 /ORGANISM="Cyanoptyche  gloeocystis , Strain SAG4.97" /LENGTH=187 /DNA_ID=CAMNT_0041990621 /DNA_START=83 /DNA_END=646 /DNA_ORIENTATION=+
MGYIFDVPTLHDIVKQGVARDLPMSQLVDFLLVKLREKYGNHVNVDKQWVFNMAGGALGSMYIIHASITEYLIIFGSPIGTDGHTGRHTADDYFFILKGEQWGFKPGQLERMVFKPGDMHHLKRGTAEAYRIPEYCFALEYARGFIPAMLPFGVVETFTNTLDFPTFARTIWLYGKAVVGELLQGKI